VRMSGCGRDAVCRRMGECVLAKADWVIWGTPLYLGRWFSWNLLPQNTYKLIESNRLDAYPDGSFLKLALYTLLDNNWLSTFSNQVHHM